jgi:hypothetical protein
MVVTFSLLLVLIIAVFAFIIDLIICLSDKSDATILCLILDCDTAPIPGIFVLGVWSVVIAVTIWLLFQKKESPPPSRRSIPPSSRRSTN